jgi:hypothetical protein
MTIEAPVWYRKITESDRIGKPVEDSCIDPFKMDFPQEQVSDSSPSCLGT